MLARRLIASGGAGGSFALPEPPPPTGDLAVWETALASPPAAITIIGDSVTAGNGVAGGERFGNVLDDLFGSDASVNSQGGSGASSAFFINPANYTLGTPDLVIIELGLNDMAGSVTKATFKANLEDIIGDVRAALATDPSVVLLIAYEIGDSYPNAWSIYADAMDEIADVDGEVVVLDLRPDFGSPTTTLLQGDLVHPNVAGHALIADLLYEFLTA